MSFAIMAFILLMRLSTGFAASDASLNWQNATITVKGIGLAPKNATTYAQRIMSARRAAVVDGYRHLAEAVKGVNVDADTTVEDFMLTSDVVRTKVNAVIQGAEVISEREIEGGYEVTMRIAMFGTSAPLAEAVLPAPKKRAPFPEPIQTVAPSMPEYDTRSSVTGLIVDCRGLNLKPVMSPVIKNADGDAIYGHTNLDPAHVIANGMASYTSDMSDGTTRAGSNPLTVKAVSLENHNGYPVISTADANRVLIENKTSGFLENSRVVFVY